MLAAVVATFTALYFGMIAAWRRYPAAGIVAVAFVTWIGAFVLVEVFAGGSR